MVATIRPKQPAGRCPLINEIGVSMTTVLPEALVAPAPGLPRTWLRHITGGGQIVETCPSWCTDSHRTDTHGALDDLQHGRSIQGVSLPAFDWAKGTVGVQVLPVRLAVDPYSAEPERAVPHILVEVAADEYSLPLSPAEFAAMLGSVRAHLDWLQDAVLGQLVAARAVA
jgi:hypothetical protein